MRYLVAPLLFGYIRIDSVGESIPYAVRHETEETMRLYDMIK